MRVLSLRAGTAMTTGLLIVAILGGGAVGAVSSDAGEALGNAVDPLIMLLVASLFFSLRLDGTASLRRAPRTVALAVGVNFLIVPVVALVLTSAIPDDALRLGVLIYCLAPCTDWFLGFTRLAGGDTMTGAALIPVQFALQLALYPVWLSVFAGTTVAATFTETGPALLTWFVLPATVGLGLRLVLRLIAPAALRTRAVTVVDRLVPLMIAAVVFSVFAANVETILGDPGSFALVLLAAFLFFVALFLITEALARLLHLSRPVHALLTMTTSARNAPLMLAVTTVAVPGQPIVYAAIILGMLIEFPHLTALTHVLRSRGRDRPAPASSEHATTR